MKLSRTGWNNVIIFSVMLFILLINTTNNKLFPKNEAKQSSQTKLLPANSVILTLAMHFPEQQEIYFERMGLGWQVTTKGIVSSFSDRQVEQIALAWQESEGLAQADDIIIDEQLAVKVSVVIAGAAEPQTFMVYPLNDQLLVYQHRTNLWLALPAALSQQLLPF